MSSTDTWALPEVKRRLLAGNRVTQADMLKATQGRAWRLSAAIYHLRKRGWNIITTMDAHKVAHYRLPHKEIQRLRQKEAAAQDRQAARGKPFHRHREHGKEAGA